MSGRNLQCLVKIIFIILFSITASCEKNGTRQVGSGETIAGDFILEEVYISEEDYSSEENNVITDQFMDLLGPDEPLEFANREWLNSFGALLPNENITLLDLQSCSWHSGFTNLVFSNKGNYAIGEPWTGPSYGIYEIHDNVVIFEPPFGYFIQSIEYRIDKLYYSNELHYSGAPVLRNIEENLVLYPNNTTMPQTGEIVRINQYYCEKIWEQAHLNSNNILYALPDRLSLNLFLENYYGKKSIEARTVKLAKTTIDSTDWYYILVDFTTEPTDGGGPYFEGWLPEEYFE